MSSRQRYIAAIKVLHAGMWAVLSVFRRVANRNFIIKSPDIQNEIP